jgi:AcrR family transcriptional regulator
MTETETTDRQASRRADTGKSVRLRRGPRRQTLLDAAASAFAEGGYERTTMDEVAFRAGVTRLIVYRHFDSKESLFKAVLERAAHGLASCVSEHLAEGPTVDGAVSGFMTAARVDPDGFRLLARRSNLHDFTHYRESFDRGAVAAADDLLAERVSDPVLRSWAARTLIALLEEATLAWLDTGDPSRDREMTDALTRSIQAMLRSFPGQR